MNSQEKIYKIAKLNPSVSSENMGDHIILEYCQEIFEEIFGQALYVNIPTRERLPLRSRRHVATSDYAFVCGTNLLASNMNQRKQWNIGIRDAIKISTANISKKEWLDIAAVKRKYQENKVILLGAGWWQYQQAPNKYTDILLNLILSHKVIHSVRDSYTEKKLREIGIHNVVNTACPTMWNLTESFCAEIPTEKSSKVITTLTNYNMETEKDDRFLETLCHNYEQVYVWLQAIEDQKYLQSLKCCKHVKVIPPNLTAYDQFLNDNQVDYIGTRLHGGIRALNKKKRTLILAVDNRAVEISKDTNLPVIKRKDADQDLEKWICNSFETKINLPIDNIQKWKNQFE